MLLRSISFILLLGLCPCLVTLTNAQSIPINFVNNPNFTEIDTCPYSWGQAFFATGWSADNEQSPDLYHTCSTTPFYTIPQESRCTTLEPRKDDGFIGMVSFGKLPNGINIREYITTRLIDTLPMDVDIFCSMSVRPRPRCEVEGVPNTLCYTNGMAMEIVYEGLSKQVVLRADEIVDNFDSWRVLTGCYEAAGREIRVRIGNFWDDVQTEKDCVTLDPDNNVGYVYVDNVVVAPFDVLPDTLVVCDISEGQFSGLNFYNQQLSWTDGIVGGPRFFSKSGTYTLIADVQKCILEESLEVIVIDESVEDFDRTITKCQKESINVIIGVPGRITWNNGDIGPVLTATREGEYVATVETSCATVEYTYNVINVDCDRIINVANIFSPNDDGNNDLLKFHLNQEIQINGRLVIYDRWGGEVASFSTGEEMIWNGEGRDGRPMIEGVYVWAFVSDDKSVVQTGNITIIR